VQGIISKHRNPCAFITRDACLFPTIQAFASFWPPNRRALQAMDQSLPRRPVLSSASRRDASHPASGRFCRLCLPQNFGHSSVISFGLFGHFWPVSAEFTPVEDTAYFASRCVRADLRNTAIPMAVSARSPRRENRPGSLSYSYLSATVGSMLNARRIGAQVESTPRSAIAAKTAARTCGSLADDW
jgi:hypothetical protein